MSIQSKKALRETIRTQRRALIGAAKTNADQQLLTHIRQHLDSLSPARVALFWPNDGEPDIRELQLTQIFTGYLPVIQDSGDLLFGPCAAELKANRYGIPEPVEPATFLQASELDVVLLPLVAFDHNCHRLGMGGGYYDRTLRQARDRQPQTPICLGVAYHFQEIDQVPVDPWDVSLDGVITDQRIWLKA